MWCPSHPTAFGGQSSRSRLDSGPSAGFLRQIQTTQGRGPLNNGGAGGFARNHNHPYSYTYNSRGGVRTGSVAHAHAGRQNPNFNNNRRDNSFSSSRSRTPRQVHAYPQDQQQQQFNQQQLNGPNLPNQPRRGRGARNRRRRQTTSPQAQGFNFNNITTNFNQNRRRTQSEPWNHDVEMLDVPPVVEPDEDVMMEDAPPLVSLIPAPDPRIQALVSSAAAMHELKGVQHANLPSTKPTGTSVSAILHHGLLEQFKSRHSPTAGPVSHRVLATLDHPPSSGLSHPPQFKLDRALLGEYRSRKFFVFDKAHTGASEDPPPHRGVPGKLVNWGRREREGILTVQGRTGLRTVTILKERSKIVSMFPSRSRF
ncbi:hypothetical protein N7474_007847 [Penicillium riverlandense]|uniref:uncharacterized protein n=1 Tax=Penicillium riverlandense TaxID=1903569 RepID=UPI002548DA82|nr:uncharacterized protein N7474_007847 [Penicillium riverlandense]KAJ5811546.1 hypothetical protein N7474_007847 [Penicillium riverlandense]